MAEGPGECPEKPPDSGGDGYKIKHSTEYHLASQDGAAGAGHFTITFPDLDSLRSPHPNRMGEQLKLERGVLDLLTHYQLACMDSKDGDFMTCRAMYTFQKDAQELQSMALNDYGQGRLQSVRVATTGHEIAPIPAWMDNGISLQMFFQKKCTSKRGTQSTPGGDNKQGYKIPWRASIQLERVPDNCILTAVQLAFINSDQATGSPSVQIEISSTNATNMYFVNDKLRSINGQTYCECYAELGLFRDAYCFVSMRVPLRRFLQELLGGFRRTIPEYTTATAASAIAADRPETVALETRQGSIRTERKVLVTICPKMCAIFAKGEHGKVATWEMDYSKDVVESVVGSTPANKCAKPKPLSGEPRRIAPFFLYETMKFSLSWDIPQLKLWAQVAFLERLCYPGVDLEQIPVLDAVRIVCDYAETEEVGSRMILCGLVIVLNIMHSCTALNDCHALKDLERLMAPKRTLWKNVIKPGKLCPDSSVQVKTAGKTVCVPVNMGFWVYQLKCKIQGTECIPVDQQRLCFNGRELSDNISLADYGITKEAVLTLIPKVKGCQ